MISENTKAILLLTSYFTSSEGSNYKTLSVNEYGYFACWLHQNGAKPVEMFNEAIFNNLALLWDEPHTHIKAKQMVGFSRLENTISNIGFDRIKALLSRGASLSLALDKWQSAGIWIMDRQHPHYPIAFKKQLKHQSPALFFGVGEPALLSQASIGFVGSRDCTTQDEQATLTYVKNINTLNYQVVSGAAKGVDSQAMLASLNNQHTAVGIVADSLFKTSASGQWRSFLKEKRLVLLSPFYPEGRFTPANAMARNKYIYLLSKATIVICSSEKGGTWEGAKENLKKNWVPLLVSSHQQPLQAGNQAILTGKTGAQTSAHAVKPETLLEQLNHLFTTTTESVIPKSVQPQQSAVSQSKMFDSSTNDELSDTNKQPEPPKRSRGFKDMFELAEMTSASGLLNDKQDSSESNKEQIVPFDLLPPQSSDLSNDQQVNDQSNVNIESKDNNKNNSTEFSIDTQLIPECDSTPSAMPLLDEFYVQVSALINQQAAGVIDKAALDLYFSEFNIIGKTALDKWLTHLVESGKLVKLKTKNKQYSLP